MKNVIRKLERQSAGRNSLEAAQNVGFTFRRGAVSGIKAEALRKLRPLSGRTFGQMLGLLLQGAWPGHCHDAWCKRSLELINSAFTVIAAALFLALPCSTAIAQSGAGSIQGTVTDTTGAVIPGVSVHVVNEATSVTSDTKSNSAGFFQVPGLFTGTYAVTITAPGMEIYKSSIELLVAQNAMINATLTPGAVTQQIVVSADAVQLTTTDSGNISATLENARINQLPMNGRSLMTLTGETAPGLEYGNRAFGLLPAANDYVVDGVTTTNLLNGGEYNGPAQLIDPDSVQEVSTQMVDASAQYASPSTSVVSTKSGANALHGTFFETARNSGWGIAKARQNAANFVVPHYVRNEFGASAGGPIIIPHLYHGKDKSFWFFAFERYSLANSASSADKVPTRAMGQGDFSGLVNGNGQALLLYDPSTTYDDLACPTPATVNGRLVWNAGQPVHNPYCRKPLGNGIGGDPGNNQIPASKMSPVAKLYYQLLNQPTSSANPFQANNRIYVGPSFEVMPQVTVRLDHVFDQNNRAYVRYSQVINSVNTSVGDLNQAAGGIAAGAAEGYGNSPTWSYIGSVGYTHVFSPTFFSETVISQQWFNTTYVHGVAPNTNYEAMLGLPNNFSEVGFPALGNGSLINSLPGSQNGYESDQVISDLNENLTKTVGRHQLQFGGRYHHIRLMDLPQGTPDTIGFAGLPTGIYDTTSKDSYGSIPNTGSADASFFLGLTGSYGVTLQPPHSHYHVMEFDSYLQDNFHVSRNFAVNFGLRYEAHPAVWYKYGLMNGFDLNNDALVFSVPTSTLVAEGYTTQAIVDNDKYIGVKFETPSEAGMPDNILRNYDLNFMPRAGIAWQPFGGRRGMVIRAGYGRYDYLINFSSSTNQMMRSTPLVASYSQSYSAANQAIDGLQNELIRYNDAAAFGVMGVNQANAVNTSQTKSILPGSSALQSISPSWAPQAATETNITLEQSLKGHSAVRVSWIWTHGTNLDVIDSYNNHPSGYQWEMATGTLAPTGGASVIGTPQQNTYAATAQGPYDQTTWGANLMKEATGWSNDNSLVVNYQRLFHRGSAYQISYVYSKAMTAGGNQGATVYPDANYPGVLGTKSTMTSPYGTIGFAGNPPPVRPSYLPAWADWHAMDDYQAYHLDSSIPKMHISFNGVVDLPFGTGKKFLGNANRFLNEVVGGFQLAGDGQVVSQTFQLAAGHFGTANPLQVYKHKYPITDCRSGVCYKAYQWANGYLAPTVTTGVAGSVCTKNCISGLPADYTPFSTPIDNTPGTTYFGDDEVLVTLPNGKQYPVGYDAGPQAAGYMAKTWLNGPVNWNADLSLFKVFPITERANLRFNVDAFNAFNIQGYTNPGGGGVEEVQPGVGQASSYWGARQIQFTMRLTF